MYASRWRAAAHLLHEGVGVLAGHDYFHARQPAGNYPSDHRCYYNDLRAKAAWHGPCREEVPVLPVPRLDTTLSFPIMIFQYGLAHLDLYFAGEDEHSRGAVAAVARWMTAHLSAEGSFDNPFPILAPGYAYFSSNSAMAQGQALSFLTRLTRYDVPVAVPVAEIKDMIDRIRNNMVRPLGSGGTALIDGDDLRFCEVCRKDDFVVLNGWIFALFGLRDYDDANGGVPSRDYLVSEATLRRDLAAYVRKDGWSNYDNRGVPASPFYHDLHVHLLTAMGWLVDDPVYDATARRLAKANRPLRRWGYTVRKARERWRRTGHVNDATEE